jgi:hypothetical protein
MYDEQITYGTFSGLLFVSALRLGFCRLDRLFGEKIALFVFAMKIWRLNGWRREWDSNPRYGFPHTRFPSVRLKPLGHLSGGLLLKGQD